MEPIEILKKNCLKITKSRIKILNALIKNDNSVSAEYIFEQCLEGGNKIDLSTIYRTLDMLIEKNIIEKIDLGNGKNSFILNRNPHKHCIKCDVCKKEVQIDCPMQQIEEIINSKTGFKLTEYSLHIKGICSECRKKLK